MTWLSFFHARGASLGCWDEGQASPHLLLSHGVISYGVYRGRSEASDPHIPFPLFPPLLALFHTMVLTTSRQPICRGTGCTCLLCAQSPGQGWRGTRKTQTLSETLGDCSLLFLVYPEILPSFSQGMLKRNGVVSFPLFVPTGPTQGPSLGDRGSLTVAP